MTRRSRPLLCLLASGLVAPAAREASAQDIRGRVTEEGSGAPVALAGVFLMDAERRVVTSALADTLGRYVLTVPEDGSYHLVVQRLGYFEAASPLVAVSAARDYDVDFSVRPEPIRLEGFAVEVGAERQNAWARDRLGFMNIQWRGSNPITVPGFRLITGARLEEAKLRSDDALEMLRWVYVPLYNALGGGMCAQMPPERWRGGGGRALTARPQTPVPTFRCGEVYLDGMPLTAEHVEALPFRDIHAVIVVPPALHLVTRDFERKFQAGRRR